MSRRSRWSAGLGPALRFVVALIALVAIGAPAVLLTGSASAQDTPAADATTTPAPAPADPPPTTTTEDPPPADGQSPQWAPTATYEAPAPAQSAPEADTPDAADPADPTGDDESQPADGVVAHNQSTVVQAIVQVQVGCRSYCHGTSQNQSASQGSSTNQNATAVAPEGSSSTATAVNESSTIQFVWQTQLGCVIFCWDTTMDQSASQEAETTQTATAVSDTAAQASNVGDTIQHVYQRQEGCRSECYGVSESQSLVQRQTTNQSASASRGDAADDWPSAGLGGLPDWLIAYAESIGATIQTIYQYQEAGCLDHCGEEALDQTATQLAATDQTSEAGDVREPVSGPLWGGPDQPAAAGPALEQPAAQSGWATAAAASEPHDGEGPAPGTRRHLQLAKSRGQGHGGTRGPGGGHAGARHADQRGIAADPAATTQSGRHVRPSGSASRAGSAARADSASAPGPEASAAFETASRTSSDGPHLPWITIGLLLVAALSAFVGLRERPRFGA